MSDFPKSRSLNVGGATFLSLVITLSFCAKSSANEFDELSRLMDAANYTVARPALRAMIKKYPKEPMLFVWLAKAYSNDPDNLRTGFEKAEQCLKHAVEVDPGFGKTYTQYSEWYSAQGNFPKAIEMATKALHAKTPDLGAYEERAHAYNSMKRDKEALADIEQALKHVTGKHRRKILLSKASILENSKQYERAIADYKEILKEDYEDTVVYREVKCYEQLNRFDEAVKLISELIKKNPEDDTSYQMRARVYTKQKKYIEAAADYSKAYEFLPTPSILRERAKVYDLMGRKDLAAKDRDRADKD